MGTGFDIMSFLPFILIFGVFYFVLLRPQQQKMKRHQEKIANLRRGDRVVTNGGLIGTISKIVSDTEVQLELSDDVRIRQVRGMIAEVLAKTDPVDTPKGTVASNTVPISSVAKKTGSSKAKAAGKTAANRSRGKA
jgi:preprotein translocase subunit YajC